MKDELLVAKKTKGKMKFKVCNREHNSWSPSKYEKIIANKDFNLLAYLFYDLYSLGYPVEKAYQKFRELVNEPDLFFLK